MATIAYPSPLELEQRRSLRTLRYIVTTDHKEIGHLYLVATLVFFVLGGFEALLIRVQLAVPGNTFLQPGSYDAVFTTHGVTMIFFVIMPMLLGFANYIVPLQIGARDMAFPRLNAFSFWLFAFGGLLFYFGFLAGAPPDTGWFSYAPLTLSPYTLQPSSDYWALGLLVSGFGTIATGLNLVVTVIKLRAPGMTWFRMPVFTWMSFITGILVLAAIPALTAAQIMLLFDRFLGTHFFDPSVGGDPVLWQHLFWYFGHPEVYIMALPAFGIISEVIPVFARKPIFGYPVIVASGIAIAFLSMSVWAHHMFTVGLGELADAAFGFSSMLIAIPTGIKVFSWLGTLWGGRIRLTTAMLYAIAFLAQFTLGGLSGVHFATVPIDWHTHDSYYVVAHFHYVLGGGTLFAILAATYYWFPKITGRLLDERMGKIGFWLTFFGFNLTFFPMHILGLMGQPRRTWTYPDLPGWGAINLLATIGAFILGVGVVLLLWNILQAFRHGERAGDNPWDAWTLEWATTSPPPAYNFAALPPIDSARPLWDLHHPSAVAVQAGPERPASVTRDVVARHVARQLAGSLAGADRRHPGVHLLRGDLLRLPDPGLDRIPLPQPERPGPWDLDVGRTAIFSVCLFASSATIYLAERQLHRGDERGFRWWWLATIVLGATFLIGQITEYITQYREGITIDQNLFTSAFYTLTGFHGLHVLVGLVMLVTMLGLAFLGDFRSGRRRTLLNVVSIYWHFVDAVWVVVFSLVYLWTLAG